MSAEGTTTRDNETFRSLNTETHVKQGALHVDIINALACINTACQLGRIEHIHPIKKYDEYYRKRHEEFKKRVPNFYDEVMKMSNSEAVAEFDRLVNAFNADIERIKTEQDFEAIKKFYDEVYRLLFKEDPPIDLLAIQK